MAADKMTEDIMTLDKMTEDKMTLDKMIADKVTADEIVVYKMTENEMSADKMTVNKMIVNRSWAPYLLRKYFTRVEVCESAKGSSLLFKSFVLYLPIVTKILTP